ncbi:MAG: hypothetical protein ACREDF_02735, partial [Thermoplasmata archaeon]
LVDIQSVDTDGFTLNQDDADPAANYVGYIAFGANVAYNMYLQIWDKSTDSVRATIGSCLGVTAAGDDQQCLLSSVASQTIASNEVVRIRVVHSGSAGTISVDYDNVDPTGNSRVTVPIPEFAEIAIPLAGVFFVAVVARRAASRRRGPSSLTNPGRFKGRPRLRRHASQGGATRTRADRTETQPGGPMTSGRAWSAAADSVPWAGDR